MESSDEMRKPIVAVVGRPNVGKSTLFNRIIGSRVAIVEDFPGVTRDRLYYEVEWLNHPFILIDTGGIQWEEDDIYSQVKKQAELAVEEADVILFVTDAKDGVLPADEEVANILRRTGKPVVLAVNKTDNFSQDSSYEFYGLGLGTPVPVSAIHGMNVGDLLDEVIAHFPKEEAEYEEEGLIRIAVIGKPNVGKSSIVNRLTGEERVIVSDIAGTTRDAIDTRMEHEGKPYLLIDTAGIRRKARIDDVLERYSVIRAFRAVDRADVVLMVLSATEGVSEQDKRIAGYAHEQGKAAILVVNKWDLVEKETNTMKEYTETIREELGFLRYAPVLFISALTGQRTTRIFEMVDMVYGETTKRISTSVINQLLREIVMLNPPPGDKGKTLKISYGTQARIKPPTFVLFVNDPELMHFSYQRHIENRFREDIGFEGTPIRILVRKKTGDQHD